MRGNKGAIHSKKRQVRHNALLKLSGRNSELMYIQNTHTYTNTNVKKVDGLISFFKEKSNISKKKYFWPVFA